MERDASRGPMVDSLRENLRMVSCTDRESMSGKMEEATRANIIKTRNTVSVRTHTQMEVSIEETG